VSERSEPANAVLNTSAADRAVTSELLRLGHTLGVEPASLEFLNCLPAADLRILRNQIAGALFEADRPLFAKVAALSKAVPVALSAKLAEHAFTPLLAARTAEVIDADRAAALVARLSDPYLADVSAAMDPGRAPHVVAGIEPARIARIGAELGRREEWVVIAAFVDVVDAKALAATVAEFDGGQLLRIGFVMEDKPRLDEINELVRDEQLDQMLSAASAQQLWQELDDLLGHLTEARAERLADRYRSAPEQVHRAVTTAAEAGLLSEASLRKLTGAC
jgi:hypothetical protein